MAPSFAQALTIASPIPLDPPVTTIVLPLNGLSVLVYGCLAICELMSESLFMDINYTYLWCHLAWIKMIENIKCVNFIENGD